MSSPELTHHQLLDQQHEQTAREAREKVRAYIALTALHIVTGGLENGDDRNEGKN